MKPTIFVSHITEEAELASILRGEIDRVFLGLVSAFQSSDPRDLHVGQNWLNNITEALRNCEAILVLCSPYSVRRPWIDFECGAGWSRNIEVVPICHSGLRPVDLPVPLSLLQGIKGDDPAGLNQIFEMIARKLGSQAPKARTAELAQEIAKFSERYVDDAEIHAHLRALRALSPDLLDTLAKVPAGLVVPIEGVPERLIERCREQLEALQRRGRLTYNFAVSGIGFAAPGSGGGGNFGHLTVQVDQKLANAIAGLLKKG